MGISEYLGYLNTMATEILWDKILYDFSQFFVCLLWLVCFGLFVGFLEDKDRSELNK